MTWSGVVSGRIEHEHDVNLRVAATIVEGRRFDMGYDRDGLMTSVKGDGLTGVGGYVLRRDPINGQVDKALLGSITETMSYNSRGEVVSVEVNQGMSGIQYAVSYERDRLGRIRKKTEQVGSTTETRCDFYESRACLLAVPGCVTMDDCFDETTCLASSRLKVSVSRPQHLPSLAPPSGQRHPLR